MPHKRYSSTTTTVQEIDAAMDAAQEWSVKYQANLKNNKAHQTRKFYELVDAWRTWSEILPYLNPPNYTPSKFEHCPCGS
jgi:hypothetical protein